MAVVLIRWLCMLAALAAVGEERDPTRPPAQIVKDAGPKATPPAVLHLSQIRIQGRQAYAWIDERRVTVGDTLGDAKVAAIDIHGVTLLRDGAAERLSLSGAPILSVPHSKATKPSP